jgi:hypothetical protein
MNTLKFLCFSVYVGGTTYGLTSTVGPNMWDGIDAQPESKIAVISRIFNV